jgi:hypothetical protein
MANETTPGAPLTASLGEQLEEKAHLDEARDAERRAEEERRAALDRHKADERENAARHASARPAGGRGGGSGARIPGPGWRRYAWGAAAAAVVGMVMARIARR